MKSTPVYGIPYPEATDLARDFPVTAQSLAETVEASLLNTGQPPVGSDLQSLLARMAALENGENLPKTGQFTGTTAAFSMAGSSVVTPPGYTPDMSQTSDDFSDWATFSGSTVTLQPGLYTASVSVSGLSRPGATDRYMFEFLLDDAEVGRRASGQEIPYGGTLSFGVKDGSTRKLGVAVFQAKSAQTGARVLLMLQKVA